MVSLVLHQKYFIALEENIQNNFISYLDNGDKFLNLLLREFSSSFGERNVCLLEAQVGVPATNTLDGGHGEHDVGLSLNVGVENTKNVLEFGVNNQRHRATVSSI